MRHRFTGFGGGVEGPALELRRGMGKEPRVRIGAAR